MEELKPKSQTISPVGIASEERVHTGDSLVQDERVIIFRLTEIDLITGLPITREKDIKGGEK